jgi:prephenate dehydrogenase
MNVALICYGEVGRILGEDLRAAGHDVAAFDLKLGSEAGVPIRAHALVHGVTLAGSHADAVKTAALVVSAVTASQTVAAADACAAALRPDAGVFGKKRRKTVAAGAVRRTRELDWRADADRILDHMKGPQEPET